MRIVWLSMFTLCCVLVASAIAAEPTRGGSATQSRATNEAEHGYAPVNGLKMYYEIHGDNHARKPPIVLLHGGGSTIETTFGKILPTLATTRQIIAFEQQGHGRTADIAERPFSFEQSAEDTVALLKYLEIEQADLFGFSNGGHIALEVGIRHPNVVHKLVIASAGFKRDGHYPQFWEFMKQAKLENMPKELRDAYRRVAPNPDQLQSFHDKCVKRMLEFKDWQAEDIQSIQAPTLVIIGDADAIRPEHAVEMFRLLPHGQLSILPGGHGAYIGEVTAATIEESQVLFGVEHASSEKSKLPQLVAAMIDEFLDAPMPELKAR